MLHLRLLPKLQPVPPKRTATSSIITPRERNVFSWFCMIFEYMILILIACLISHTLNDLLFIIYYKFVIIFPMSFCLTHSTQKLRASFSDFLWLAHCEKCPNTDQDQKKLRVWTLFTQWHHHSRFLLLLNAELNQVLTQTILIQSCFLVRNI